MAIFFFTKRGKTGLQERINGGEKGPGGEAELVQLNSVVGPWLSRGKADINSRRKKGGIGGNMNRVLKKYLWKYTYI
jgi:hypothetical protein